MYTIPTDTPSQDFGLCWQAAGRYLETLGAKTAKELDPKLLMLPPGHEANACVWLKAELRPPFLEYLSYRLGNQLFFIRLEDIENKLGVPGTRLGLQRIADACKGHACLMPMLKRGGQWIPASSDWGLASIPETNIQPPHPDAYGLPIVPPALVTSEKIEMTDWELQDFAVQIVRNSLAYEKVMSWNADPAVSPSLWFAGEDGPEWIIVKAVRYPEMNAEPPNNIEQIAKDCSRLSRKGNFAVVGVCANCSDPSAIYRGCGLLARYTGMSKLKV